MIEQPKKGFVRKATAVEIKAADRAREAEANIKKSVKR
jgi:hypothetical protein